MTIYLIEGKTGEYVYNRTWVSRAFTDKRLAQSTMELWQQFADKCYNQHTYSCEFNPPDPHFSIGDTGTTYQLIELELVTDKFTEFVLGITNEQSNTNGGLQHTS